MYSVITKTPGTKMRIAWDKIALGVAALLVAAAFGFWLRMYFYGLGINDVFSREYVFQDDREFGEGVAIEVTRIALQRYGCDVSAMAPQTGLITGNSENSGRVTWGPSDLGRPREFFIVRIDKVENEFRCRVYRNK